MGSDAETELAALFDEMACRGEMCDFSPEQREKVKRLLVHWQVHPGQHILEPGCGAGRLTGLLANAVGPTGSVYAIDLSPQMIARARARRLPPNVVFAHASVTAIDRPDGEFDQAICFCAFPHFPERHAALTELARVLKPGGSLWISHLLSRDQVNALHLRAGPPLADHLLPDEAQLRADLAAAGFSLCACEDGTLGYSAHAVRSA